MTIINGCMSAIMKNIELLIIHSVGSSFDRTQDRLKMALINGRISALMRQRGHRGPVQGRIGEFPTREAVRTLRNWQGRKGPVEIGTGELFAGKVVRVVKSLRGRRGPVRRVKVGIEERFPSRAVGAPQSL